MGPLIALLVIVLVSLLIVRVGSTALLMTGLSSDAASFQAYSAFFGVGFTTSEAEMVVNHPLRRRIIRDLILAGNVGVTSGLATLVVTFVQKRNVLDVLSIIGIILIGVLALYVIVGSKPFQKWLDTLIRAALRRSGAVQALDYELLLRVPAGYCVLEMEILPCSPMAGKSLSESRPADSGIVVLGILDTSHSFRGAPKASDRVEAGDVVTVYGLEPALKKINGVAGDLG